MEYMEIYGKELAHTVIETGKSKICSVGWQTEDRGGPLVQPQSGGSLL